MTSTEALGRAVIENVCPDTLHQCVFLVAAILEAREEFLKGFEE